MNPLYQRLITMLAGMLAALLVQYVPGVEEQHARDILSAILGTAGMAWAARHPADKAVKLPETAIIAYDKLINAGNRDLSKPDSERR